MNRHFLELYTDYLLSSFGQTTATAIAFTPFLPLVIVSISF